MEEFILKMMEMSAIAAVSIVALLGYQKIRKPNGYDRKTYEIAKTIESNHLNSIEEAIKNQTIESNEGRKEGNEWHRKQYEKLCEISGKLERR